MARMALHLAQALAGPLPVNCTAVTCCDDQQHLLAQLCRGLVPAECSAVMLSNLPHATVSLPVCPACEAWVLDLLAWLIQEL